MTIRKIAAAALLGMGGVAAAGAMPAMEASAKQAAAAATADWGWMDWGVKPDALVAAGKGRVALEADRKEDRLFGLHRLAKGEEKFGEVPLVASYYFDPKSQELQVVDLVPDRAQCAAFEETLLAGGDPASSDRGDLVLDPKRPPALMRELTWNRADGGTTRYIHISSDATGTLFCKAIVTAPGFVK